jgi:hypothetical protein
MKSLLRIFIGALMLSLVFAGCKKDDEEPDNYLHAGDANCVLTHGNLIYNSSSTHNSTPFYVFGIELFSQGVTLSTSGTGHPVYSGSGVGVYISLFTSESPRPADGDDYVYHEWSATNNHALSEGYYSLDFVGSKSTYNYFADGTVTVHSHRDEYIITFKGNDDSGTAIELQYTGKLKYYDGSGWSVK